MYVVLYFPLWQGRTAPADCPEFNQIKSNQIKSNQIKSGEVTYISREFKLNCAELELSLPLIFSDKQVPRVRHNFKFRQ